ncbi:MAG: methionyl-tRNA synthetase [Candidatus Methanomethylophilaceae archaeon]|nr:methionyl-tRNA synthetase [Candidatus Methanomethylophilaceae archaeon]MDI3542037.1 methionyl-tRNA synthetase [Candidatus Methanomethylophilaceae archaeon]
MSKVFIGVAWPYANGVVHLGHLAGSLLPPDIFRRYNVLKGNEVLMVSGSDQHGTPITLTAEKERVSPEDVAERFHRLNKKAIEDMGIGFSLFTKTHNPCHENVVHDVFLRLYNKGHLERRMTMQYYCAKCNRFLPDRYVEGVCPNCGCVKARGDQCDECGKTFEVGELKEGVCIHCHERPQVRETEHFFLKLSEFQDVLLRYLDNKEHWRPSVKTFTRNWLEGGLQDRPITRDMDWGIPVPLDGWEGKVIYVWFEAVIGYLSASKEYSVIKGEPDLWKKFWKEEDVKHYYFLGKDNIPYHSIIWPAILMGYGGLHLPDEIPANEYLTFKGDKLSKSRGVSIDIPSVLERYSPDLIRYYLTINMPDHRDAEFSWEDFATKINNELVAELGNYYHRVLSFTYRNFGSVPPVNEEDLREVRDEIQRAAEEIDTLLASCDFKKALKAVMELARYGNRYFDSVKPWALLKEDREACGSVLHANLEIVRALALFSHPFLPFSSETIWGYLGLEGSPLQAGWEAYRRPLSEKTLSEPSPVFTKVDVSEEAEYASGVASFDDFRRLDLRVGKIIDVREHPDADKLYVIKLKLSEDGEERQVVAGLRSHYSKEELIGKKVIVVYNLKPAKLRGIKSYGMLLAADDEGLGGRSVKLLTPSVDLPNGTRVDCGLGSPVEAIGYNEFQKVDMRVSTDDQGNKVVVVRDGEAMMVLNADGVVITVDGCISDGAKVR